MQTVYVMRISDWSSDVCSSYLRGDVARAQIIGAGDRRAGRHAALGAIERVGDIGEVGDICRTIDRSVAAERARNFPGPGIGELAAKAEGALQGFGLLEDFSRPDRERTRLTSST